MAGKRLARVTPLAIQDKREYGHRCDQQDAEYDGPNQKAEPALGDGLSSALLPTPLFANAAIAASRVGS
jgi:hypothetical protein